MSTIRNSKLLSLKKQMNRAYDVEDWQELAELDKQCQKVVSHIIQNDPRAMFDELREILGFYADLIARCEIQKNRYAQDVKQMRQGRHHRDTYANLEKLSVVCT